jgi:NAD(P)-dependent dehydrogenase (short-subunit alcohol dehydrogenase family)
MGMNASAEAEIPFPARLGAPAEFADAVMFMICNDYVNGEVLRLDGALRLGRQ